MSQNFKTSNFFLQKYPGGDAVQMSSRGIEVFLHQRFMKFSASKDPIWDFKTYKWEYAKFISILKEFFVKDNLTKQIWHQNLGDDDLNLLMQDQYFLDNKSRTGKQTGDQLNQYEELSKFQEPFGFNTKTGIVQGKKDKGKWTVPSKKAEDWS